MFGVHVKSVIVKCNVLLYVQVRFLIKKMVN